MTNVKSEPIEAVLFDWGGTLATWHTIDLYAVWRSVARLVDEERADELAAKLLAAEDSVWTRSRDEHLQQHARGGLPAGRGGADARPRWRSTNRSGTRTPSWSRMRWRRWRLCASDGLKIGVLSNTIWSRRRHEEIFARDGVLDLIDGAVYTSEVPWTKPHPEAFLAAMKAVGVTDPARCLFVGDRLFDDVWGAQNVGMRAAHIPHSAIPANQIGHTEGTPDATIHRLAELATPHRHLETTSA